MKNTTVFRTFILTLIFQLFISSTSYSQHYEERLSNLFETRYKGEESGASILISKNGKILYSKQFGLTDVKKQIPITENTTFAIGSITKQFTAAAILILQERGKLNVKESLGKYLPEFAGSNYKEVKIEHLLTHTSGIPSDNKAKVISKNFSKNITPQAIANAIKNEPLLFQPGEKFDYSNNGYMLLGLVIEKVSRLSYGEFLKKNIFKPLKMKNTYVFSPQNSIKNKAKGYTKDNNDKTEMVTYNSSSFSAGAIVSAPKDLNKWVTGLFSKKVIDKKSLNQMLTNYTLLNNKKINKGFGWELNKINGSKSFEHSGFEPGFKANSIYVPEEKLYVVVLQNNEVGSPTPATIKATAISLNKPYPTKNSKNTLSINDLNNIIGTYQLKGGGKRIIGKNDQGFYYKAQGGKERQLYATNENTLFFDREYIQLHFEKDIKGNIIATTYKNRNYEAHLVKISNDIPKENVAISIPITTLKKYIGSYKSEQFTMKISLENENLFAQPEGADKLKLLSKANNKFFIKELGAEIEFVSDNSNAVKYINILLEGNMMKGIKITN